MLIGFWLSFNRRLASTMNEKVLLINDHAFELITLSEVLTVRGINIVGKAQTLVAAESFFRTLHPDVVVIDIGFNSMDGVALGVRLRGLRPEIGVVHTTSCSDTRLLGIRERELSHSSIVVLKRSIGDLDLLCEAILGSAAARSREESVKWVNKFPQLDENSHSCIVADLTDIQVETLRLVSRGFSNSEIAKIRFVSEKAVEQIVARIAAAMGFAADRRKNLRVLMTNEFNRWVGSSGI